MSKALGILRRSRRFTLLMGMVALLVLGFLATQPPDALAGPVLKPQYCTFYSDASHSTQVGWAVYNCYGQIVQQSGTTSAYRLCDYDYCCSECYGENPRYCTHYWC